MIHHFGVVHVAARHSRRVHKPASGIDTDVRLHPEVPLVPLLRGVHLRIALAALFLVDGDAAISVASTIVPPRSRAPRASRCSATASNTVFVSSCASSRCRKFKIVVSSGIGSRPSSRLQNARIDWISRALPRRPDQTDCTTAAGSRCATSRRSETADDRLEGPPSDNAARSLLPALTTAPPPPSRLETRRASCASSCLHSPASRSSAARPYCRPRIKGAVCHDPEVDQRFPRTLS